MYYLSLFAVYTSAWDFFVLLILVVFAGLLGTLIGFDAGKAWTLFEAGKKIHTGETKNMHILDERR